MDKTEIKPIATVPPERVSRIGSLQFLKTQLQLLQQDNERIADRLRSHAPETAERFEIIAATCEVFAHIVIELQQGQPENGETDYINANRQIQSLALFQRLLHVIVVTSAISDAANGDGPEWLRELLGRENGAE
jgi:hypothetical protein